MRLMYHDIGVVRQDKSLIRHRVFVTRLKPGCEEEYKRRHDGLIAARGDAVSQGPDSNFTIWCGAGYIFGYCEKVKAFDREMTEAEKADTIAWETRQLEIMDWLTDDVDWITGEKHEKIRQDLKEAIFLHRKLADIRTEEGKKKDDRHRRKRGGNNDSKVRAEFVAHRAALTRASGDRRVGDKGKVIAKHCAAYYRAHTESEIYSRTARKRAGDRADDRDSTARSTHCSRNKAGNHEKHQGRVLRGNKA
jgi:L-rhamnose mutarotase